jgi:hypothetical protein
MASSSQNLKAYLLQNHLYFLIIGVLVTNMVFTALLTESTQEENRLRQEQNRITIEENQRDENKEVQRAQNQNEIAISQNDYMIGHLDNATKLITDLINRSNVAGNSSQARFDNLLNTINQTVGKIVEDRANLTAKEQSELIYTLRTGIPELINISEKMLNFTKFISESFDEEYLIDEVRQYKQSNNTEANIKDIQEDLYRIQKALNITE